MNILDKIFIIDLHGNSKKQEKDLDGLPDQNVFDIMVGVSVIIGVKNKNIIDKKEDIFF